MTDALNRLSRTIAERKEAHPQGSWTAQLLAAGPEKAAQKFGEEAVEAVIEAIRGDRERLAEEAADVLYHLLVMLAARNIDLDEVLKVLEEREGISGVEEKAVRKS
ncbi:MAG: phosphoribosyl-ATP diphosphatase [Boseongicola sp. SB0664_bin_43]|uniref:Phosphoribosyl-ATP pyrophosphatase n=1 Tax=Boseongicola sp. SB0664_bin_43 TaxID=2604844 RepID=A0A6B0XZZ6_9RHOB|nr:phosphoribosyl-ATP diphosphatase [Boseongicola sp. SB0664_bin_43]